MATLSLQPKVPLYLGLLLPTSPTRKCPATSIQFISTHTSRIMWRFLAPLLTVCGRVPPPENMLRTLLHKAIQTEYLRKLLHFESYLYQHFIPFFTVIMLLLSVWCYPAT